MTLNLTLMLSPTSILGFHRAKDKWEALIREYPEDVAHETPTLALT